MKCGVKKLTIFSIVSILIVTILNAQDNSKMDYINLNSLSLSEAVEYSLDNSTQINIKRLKEIQEEAKLSQINLDYLPNIYLTSDLRRNIVIPTTPIPASMINPSAPVDELMYMRFNTPWNSAAGVNVSLDIFNPETFGKKSEQKYQLGISKLERQIEENDVRAIVSQAYIDCLIAEEQLRFLVSDTVYYGELLRNANNLYERGKISLIDKNNSQLNFNNSLSNLSQGNNIYYNAKVNLLLLMGKDVDNKSIEIMELTDDIDNLYCKMLHNNYSVSSDNRSYKLQNEIVNLSTVQTRNARLKYLPSVTLSGYYGANYYDHTFSMNNPSKWFGNSFISLSIKVPISKSLSNSKLVSQLKIQEIIEFEKFDDIKNNKNANILIERNSLQLKIDEYNIKKTNLELFQNNIIALKSKLDKGYIVDSDYFSEKIKEHSAYQEYLQAAYDVLSALINIERIKNN